MFEIRVICDDTDVPAIAQAILGSIDALSVRRLPTRDRARTRLYITAEPRGRHHDDECGACDENGTVLWLLPNGTQEHRPCTGLDSDELHMTGLTQSSSRREPWHRHTAA
ncbi:hypothetical protein [Streptomyces canus]|uniref:hypothetical protein n=1 Tax=Streptomyces canus TaxID=58343 RepID=UPI0030E23573